MQEALFWQYARIVKRNFGIQLTIEKKALLEARLFKLLNRHIGEPCFADEQAFYDYIREDVTGRAMGLLAEAITTHHTFFMREADHFDFFGQRVLPYLAQTIKDGDLRVWCAACSSGEEAYILQMEIQDFVTSGGLHWDTDLLATDLSKDILEVAKAGIYPDEALTNLPVQWKLDYFRLLPEKRYQVQEPIRQKIIFRRFNLMEPSFPFRKPFHVIFCRNVMIYFDAPTRNALLRKFYDFLEPGGYLFLGHSESIDMQRSRFEYVMPSVYRKR